MYVFKLNNKKNENGEKFEFIDGKVFYMIHKRYECISRASSRLITPSPPRPFPPHPRHQRPDIAGTQRRDRSC